MARARNTAGEAASSETVNDQRMAGARTALDPVKRHIFPSTLQFLPYAFHHSTSVPVYSQKPSGQFQNIQISLSKVWSVGAVSASSPHQSCFGPLTPSKNFSDQSLVLSTDTSLVILLFSLSFLGRPFRRSFNHNFYIFYLPPSMQPRGISILR